MILSECYSPVFVGTLPPPITGRTIATANVIEALSKQGYVSIYNVSIRHRLSRWLFIPVKCARSMGALIFLLFQSHASLRTLYLVANHAGGLWYDVLLALIARAKGFKTVLHHQVYSYVRERDFRMALLCRILGPQAIHVHLSDAMARDFAAVYKASKGFLIVHNLADTPLLGATIARELKLDSSIVLGHLSNLTLEKGLDSVIATFKAMHELRWNVSLTLAGPATGREERKLIADTLKAFPGRVRHLGAIYGQDKAQFLSAVDVFLFPTRYRNEAQPLVVLEALEHGVPVIANGIGCIPDLLRNCDGALVVNPASDFAAAATEAVRAWVSDPERYQDASQAALEHGHELTLTSELQIARLIGLLRHPEDWEFQTPGRGTREALSRATRGVNQET